MTETGLLWPQALPKDLSALHAGAAISERDRMDASTSTTTRTTTISPALVRESAQDR